MTNIQEVLPVWSTLRRFILIASFAAVITAYNALSVAASSLAGRAVLSQEIAVSLKPERHLLEGETTVAFSAAGKVKLFLAPNATIQGVTAAGEGVPYTFHEDTVTVDLSRFKAPVLLRIRYLAAFNDAVAQHPASSEEPTYGVSGAITSEGSFLGADSRWYPIPDAIPLARSVRVEAPAGTEAITSGKRVTHETRGRVTTSTWVEAHPVGVLSLSAGPYVVSERRVGDIDLYTYFYAGNAPLAARYLDAAAHYIAFYSALLGAYPFEKFAAVENFFPTGYGLPSYTLLGSSVIRLPFIINTSFPHEIAHSWWGNGIEADAATGNWSEGLVTYLADYLLKEKISPREGREYRQQILADYASLVTPGREFPLRRFVGRVDPASRAIGYGKGAMLFHMVRRKIGDEAFFAALREVCRTRMYGVAAWDDFVAAFSHAAGEDLAPFMSQWLNGVDGPHLSLAGVQRRPTDQGGAVYGVVRQTPPFFRFEVPVVAQVGKGGATQTVPVSEENNPFTIITPQPPLRLLLDPDADVFRVLSEAELPPTVNRIKGSHGVMAVVTNGCRAGKETLRLLLQTLDQGGATVVKEAEVDRATLAKSDVIFCGAPPARLLPALPREVSVSDAGFAVEGEHFVGDADLLFMVGNNPLASGKVAAVFLPLSPEAAERAVPKITHYGKYGYLVFSGGQNRLKGSFAAPPGPSVVEFE